MPIMPVLLKSATNWLIMPWQLLEVAIARDQPDILYSDEAIVYGHLLKSFHFL